ncbi:grasp-with-spasm system SPASM domain peptide maturase [marine bacterium AO1-C]|nr:grasp-with-spasm system SPASM domain peptide maturase [marine bacterium AO1-C]
MKSHFVLFACCIPVKGASRSTICDLQRNSFELVPNVLHEILTEHTNKSIQEVFEVYDHEYNEEIKEYFDFLVDKNYGFYSNEPHNFPKLDLTWHNPLTITNALVDFDRHSTHDLSVIVTQLSSLYCSAIELRFFSSLTLEKLRQVIRLFDNTTFRSVQITVGYHPELTPESLFMIRQNNERVQEILVHSTPQIDEIVLKEKFKVAIYTSQKINTEACCGNISPHYFTSRVEFFTETQSFNSCLNRKISIDKRGYIKNCPSMSQAYGHIDDTTLASVAQSKDFQKVWHISKDQVSICQDCEFRYICTDCRAYLATPNDILSKPAKCSYNPYEANWEDSSREKNKAII